MAWQGYLKLTCGLVLLKFSFRDVGILGDGENVPISVNPQPIHMANTADSDGASI